MIYEKIKMDKKLINEYFLLVKWATGIWFTVYFE